MTSPPAAALCSLLELLLGLLELLLGLLLGLLGLLLGEMQGGALAGGGQCWGHCGREIRIERDTNKAI